MFAICVRAICRRSAPGLLAPHGSRLCANKHKFVDLGLSKELVSAMASELNVFVPNAVQGEALPLALAGKDVMVCAQTGSGKTLTFLLPILQRLSLLSQPPGLVRKRKRNSKEARKLSAPEALVLVPSRELALQVHEVACRLSRGFDAPPALEVITNGAPYTPQKLALRTGAVRVLVATPARLLYHLEEGSVSLERLRMVAIDEADAVLFAADGIEREADQVLGKLPTRRPPQVRHGAERASSATGRDEQAGRLSRQARVRPRIIRSPHAADAFRVDSRATSTRVLRRLVCRRCCSWRRRSRRSSRRPCPLASRTRAS